MGILHYDADCGFCTASATRMARMGGTLRIVPLQSIDAAAAGIDPDRGLREVPHVADDGTVSYGAAAIGAALAETTAPWSWAGRLLLTPPLQVLARPVYHLVARYRHRLPGGTATCRLPQA